jgi:FixJ family two-component response regulator
MRPPTVFIVDDDPSHRDSLQFLLESSGLVVRSFSSARDFLNGADPEMPGCLLLDVRMPGMDGLELQRKLAEAKISLPIIFITGHGTVSMSVRAMKAGAVDFLEKPFDDEDLFDAIHRAIEQDRQTRAATEKLRASTTLIRSLSPREYEVFTLLVSGRLNRQIAHRLGITERTIKAHRARIKEKLKADSLADLVRHAEKLGVGTPSDWLPSPTHSSIQALLDQSTISAGFPPPYIEDNVGENVIAGCIGSLSILSPGAPRIISGDGVHQNDTEGQLSFSIRRKEVEGAVLVCRTQTIAAIVKGSLSN